MGKDIVKKEEPFRISTIIKVQVIWEEEPQTLIIAEERKKFENKVQEVANFFNEKLGENILNVVNKIL